MLEFPADWIMEPSSSQINLRDGATAEEGTCLLAVSCLRLPPGDWSGLPLSRLLLEAIEGDDRDRISAAARSTLPSLPSSHRPLRGFTNKNTSRDAQPALQAPNHSERQRPAAV